MQALDITTDPVPAYRLERSARRRRTVGFSIDRDGTVVLRTPSWYTHRLAEEFLSSKRSLIERMRANARQVFGRPIISDDLTAVTFLGVSYRVRAVELDSPRRVGAELLVPSDSDLTIHDQIVRWLRAEAEAVIGERVRLFADVLGVIPKSIVVNDTRSKWGSCMPDNRLFFCYKIIAAPLSVVDYLVVHELAHIRRKDHSASFWSLVEEVLPDYRKLRAWLRDHGEMLQQH